MHLFLYHSPVEGYVPFPEEHLAFELWSPIGRKGHSRSRKGYVVVQSDRDPTKEVRTTINQGVITVNLHINR